MTKYCYGSLYSEKPRPFSQIPWPETNIVVHGAASTIRQTYVTVVVNNVTMVTTQYKQRPLGALCAQHSATHSNKSRPAYLPWDIMRAITISYWLSELANSHQCTRMWFCTLQYYINDLQLDYHFEWFVFDL